MRTELANRMVELQTLRLCIILSAANYSADATTATRREFLNA